jgi:hypothetical protein
LAAHPADNHPRHELYLICDDIHATVAELKTQGVEFTADIAEEQWGLTTAFNLPGAGCTALYEPKHPLPTGSPG